MKYLTVFSDASFHPSGAAGYAFYVRDDETILKEACPVPFKASSSTEVEMLAMCHAILHAVDSLSHQPGDCVVAQTDCNHVIRCFDPMTAYTLAESNMRDSVMRVLNATGLSLRFKHVPAHTGNTDKRSYVNRFCDTHARRMQRVQRRTFVESSLAIS